jgi:hypothetical protein
MAHRLNALGAGLEDGGMSLAQEIIRSVPVR